MSPLVFLTPLWMLFEIAQLIACERHLGIRQIERGTDPRAQGPGETAAFFWSAAILVNWLWLLLMLFQSLGRLQVAAMMAITAVGYSIRRACGLKWVLVVLTFEGALRLGMLLSLTALIWRRL